MIEAVPYAISFFSLGVVVGSILRDRPPVPLTTILVVLKQRQPRGKGGRFVSEDES